jgi:hypothetical protein
MKRLLIATVAAATMAALGLPAQAELSNVEIVFVKADRNGDLALSKGEVLIISIEQFQMSDADGNGLLEADEVGELAKEAEFSDNDADKSGALSLEEMIEEKLADFARIDEDENGSLSLDEIKKAYDLE